MTYTRSEIAAQLSNTVKLAALVGTHRNTIANWRTGRNEPSYSDGLKLALALGIPPSILDQYLRMARQEHGKA